MRPCFKGSTSAAMDLLRNSSPLAENLGRKTPMQKKPTVFECKLMTKVGRGSG